MSSSTRTTPWLLGAAACAAIGCGADERASLPGRADAGADASVAVVSTPDPPDAGAGVCQKMDILFVIDDSGSMSEEQAGLVQSFPAFVSVLDSFKVQGGGLLDYRVAVTTTGRDVTYSLKTTPPMPEFVIPMNQKGMNGVLRQDCGMSRRWIERGDANVASTFGCVAHVGTTGPGVEMPLLAAELALGDRVKDGTNAGFLRDDALLAIVFITDEEDCSRRDNDFIELNDMCEVASPNVIAPAHFVQFLDATKKGAGRWAAAAIAGPGVCQSAFGSAYEAARLKEFVSLAGPSAVFSSICAGSFANALEDALGTFTAACRAFPPPK
ncbi:MAG: hypothetical protein IPG50_04940 [Myxococcales bacterium]|nr:hypothetical protein [Myxococcales bacterium]